MKKKIAYTLFALCLVFAVANLMADQGGIAGRTGSPTETNCTNCHDDFTLNSGGGSIVITDNIPAEGYTGGVTYTITVTVTKAGVPVFGFDLEALSSAAKSAGTLIVKSSTTTQLLAAGNGRSNITHKKNGGLTTGSHAFSFNWKAPATTTGNVTFYTAGVAGNNNAKSTGDYVYTTTLTVLPFLNTLTTNALSTSSLCSGQTGLSISYTATGTYGIDNVFTAQLSDASGSFASPLAIGTLTSVASGTITSTVPLPAVTGTLYRIRVVASSPAFSGTDNGNNLIISLPPDNADAGITQSVCRGTATLAGNLPSVGAGAWSLSSGSGTITNLSNPLSTVTGLGNGDNTFTWTISNGTCAPSASSVIITRVSSPSIANAGTDQVVCGTNFTLAGNRPVVGVGSWQLISGSATIADTTNPSSGVSDLATGTNVFTWTISNGICTPSIDTVKVTSVVSPTVAVAGPDQTACTGSVLLTANIPLIGSGLWVLINGEGTIAAVLNPNTLVTGLDTGANIFTWTISNAPCPASSDTVVITRAGSISVAHAGADQVVCSNSATLAGNIPVTGIGNWSFISGLGNIVDPTNPSSVITNLGVGVNVFVWTISNGSCVPTTDTVNITRVLPPTIANAGTDQNACTNSTGLNANPPLTGAGVWQVISGGGIIVNPLSPATAITGLDTGINKLTWTISNSICPVSVDTMIIVQAGSITIANAGADRFQCADTALLMANIPIVGTGSWSLISGAGTIANALSPVTKVTGLKTGDAIFRWTISNGNCTPSIDDVVVHNCVIPNTISTGGIAGSPFCSLTGYNVVIPFTTTGFLTGTYSAELSDSSGNFSNATVIGTGTQSPISAIIPELTIAGAHYRIRIVNNSSAVTGTDNAIDLSINTCGNISTLNVSGSPFCKTTAYSLLVPFAFTGIYTGYFIAELSDSSGEFTNPVVVGSGSVSPISSVIPAATIPGFNYRVRVSNTNPPIIGTDNGIALSINTCLNDSITTGLVNGSPFCQNTSLQLIVPFTYTGNFSGSFIAELSDSAGNFLNPVPIGSGAASPVFAIIPALTLKGSEYRIRVVNTSPPTMGIDNGIDLEINDCNALILSDSVNGSPFCTTTSYNANVYFSVVGSLDGPFIAQLSDASGSFDNPVSIGYGNNSPIAATIPFATIPGFSYRIRVMDYSSRFATAANANNLSINTCAANGINNLTSDNSVVIYPNPNKGLFNLLMPFDFQGHFSLTVLNVLGDEVLFKPDEQTYPGEILSYNVPFADKGIFFVKIKTSNSVLIERMAVE